LTAAEVEKLIADGEPFVFSHSLEDQLGGQVAAGLVLEDLFEDSADDHAACRYLPLFLATRATKRVGPASVAKVARST
jgi:hypothetical protein